MAQIAVIATAISDLVLLGKKLFGLYTEAKKRNWIKGTDELRDKIQTAQTDEEKMALAKLLFEHRAG